MKKVIIVLLALGLALAVAGAGLAANPGQAQTTCPVLGGKINQDVYADCQGHRVYFCCLGLRGEVPEGPGEIPEQAEGPGSNSGRRSPLENSRLIGPKNDRRL